MAYSQNLIEGSYLWFNGDDEMKYKYIPSNVEIYMAQLAIYIYTPPYIVKIWHPWN